MVEPTSWRNRQKILLKQDQTAQQQVTRKTKLYQIPCDRKSTLVFTSLLMKFDTVLASYWKYLLKKYEEGFT